MSRLSPLKSRLDIRSGRYHTERPGGRAMRPSDRTSVDTVMASSSTTERSYDGNAMPPATKEGTEIHVRPTSPLVGVRRLKQQARPTRSSVPVFCFALLFGVLLSFSPVSGQAQSASSGTVPFVLDGNRVYARVEFITPEGTSRKALVFVDLGSPSMILSKDLYAELGVGSNKTLGLRIGEMTISMESADVTNDAWLPFSIGQDRKVEALLPAGVLQQYQVRFDYADHTMTLAQPATLRLQGAVVPLRLNPKTGLSSIETKIDGKIYPITIDNGSGYTWIRMPAAKDWFLRHPDWQRGIGAVGPSNMRMADDGIETTGTLVRIAEIKLGSMSIRQVGALAIAPDDHGHDFMDWYSTKNAVPVIGWLGGNVLRHYRITLDYPRQMSYWERQSALDSHDLDYVGLTLLFRHGEYYVGQIAARGGRPTVTGIQVGDKLVQVGKLRTYGASRDALFAAMHGKPEVVRQLIVERDGRLFHINASVTAF